jgi:hypothetical protein
VGTAAGFDGAWQLMIVAAARAGLTIATLGRRGLARAPVPAQGARERPVASTGVPAAALGEVELSGAAQSQRA